ncbi:MAG: FAD-dependent oxidoreductase [Candidatus Methylomirabilales bacterium]
MGGGRYGGEETGLGSMNGYKGHLVIMVGAGPAALYATGKLTEKGHTVLMLNRDVKPGGLAEYGIYLSKHKMKEGLRKQFRQILANPRVIYFGNVKVGEGAAVCFSELQDLKPSAIVVGAGAQGTKSLGVPGDDGPNVYHAKDLVYHYNLLPPFSEKDFPMGQRVAIIGIGNVMADIANYLVTIRKVPEVIAVARRGPVERKYDDREMRPIAWHIDKEAVKAELERIRPRLEPLGQDMDVQYKELTKDCHVEPKAGRGPTRLSFRFLASPKRIVRDETGRMVGMEVEENTLVERKGSLAAKGLGETTVLPVDTVVFAIGDVVDLDLGLSAIKGGWGYATNPNPDPHDPEAARYQVFDPQAEQLMDGVFVVGWSRSASEGVVGKARLDGEKGAAVVNRYLSQRPGLSRREIYQRIGTVYHRVREKSFPVVHKGLWRILEQVEREEAHRRGLEEFKFGTNEEMLRVVQERVKKRS